RPRPWKRVLVPYLYGDHDRAAVGVAQRLAQMEAESVTILHVIEPDEEPAHTGRFRESVDGAWCEVRVVAAADPLRAAVDADPQLAGPPFFVEQGVVLLAHVLRAPLA